MADSARLRVLTFPHEPPDNVVELDATLPCDGTYRCECAACHLDRLRRVRAGVQTRRQPWHTQRAA